MSVSGFTVLCLQLSLEQIRGVHIHYPADSEQRSVAISHPNVTFSDTTSKADYEGSIGFPVDYNWTVCDESTSPEEREEILKASSVDINSHFLVHKVILAHIEIILS